MKAIAKGNPWHTPLSLWRTLELLHHPDLTQSLTAFPTPRDLKRTHAHILASGLAGDPFTVARLLASAANSPCAADLRHAQSLFASVDRPTRFMYNAMIRGFSQGNEPHESVGFYIRMLRAGVPPDGLTFPFLIKSCSVLPCEWAGKEVHCHAAKLGLDSDVFVVNNLITLYAEWGDLDAARKVFDQCIGVADVVSWTALVTGYSNAGELSMARWYFDRMPSRNMISWNAMVAGYARSGRAAEARSLFDGMPERNVASWSSVISGFAQCGLCKEALAMFKEMISASFVANEPALVSAISACTRLRALEQGEWVSQYMEECKVEMNVTIGTALLDMYGKCGNIRRALQVFKDMPTKNVMTWNSMITGLAMNGSGRQALTLFWKMKLVGMTPNAVTFIGLLSACSHAGLVDEGHRIFDMMTGVYGIRPMEEHYGCMVDLLGRAGLVDEAVDFVDKMPIEPHPGLLGALAGACRIHGNLELGEELGKRLVEMEPHHSGRYALLYNMYAAARKWNDAAMVSELLKGRGVVKLPGNSVVE